jgi:hypothetical protein
MPSRRIFLLLTASITAVLSGQANAATQLVSRAANPTSFTANGASTGPTEWSDDLRYVTFVSLAGNLIANDQNRVTDVFLFDAQNSTIERVSVGASGVEANDSSAGYSSISGDARYVAFTSRASNLVSGDSNALEDVFVRDRTLAVTRRLSVSNALGNANGASTQIDLAQAGRYACFVSQASNLVANDTNDVADVFRVDLQASAGNGIVRVNVGTAGQASAEATRCAISSDGNRIAFLTADGLLASDNDSQPDVYVRDVNASTTTLISNGATANFETVQMPQGRALADGGDFVVFSTRASLLAADTNTLEDVYRRSLVDQSLVLVSVGNTGQVGNGSNSGQSLAISSDGQSVLFSSSSTNLVTQTITATSVFLRSLSASTTTLMASFDERTLASGLSRDGQAIAFRRDPHDIFAHNTPWIKVGTANNRLVGMISRPGLGANAGVLNSLEDRASASNDGRLVVYTSASTNLIASDTNNASDVFLFDRRTQATRRISTGSNGEQVDCPSLGGTISGNGRYALVLSCGNLLGNGASTASFGLYRIDLTTNARVLINRNAQNQVSVGSYRDSDISEDGNFVVYSQTALDLVSPSPDNLQVYLHDVSAGTTVLVSRAPSGLPNGEAQSASISANGAGVVFVATSSNLVSGDTNGQTDVFYFERATSVVSRVSLSSVGGEADAGAQSPAVSADGRFVAFSSNSILVGGGTQGFQIYVRDRTANSTSLVSSASGPVATLLPGLNVLPAISGDGRFVSFQSNSTFIANNANGDRLAMLFDRITNTLRRIAVPAYGTVAESDSFVASMRGNGSVIVFDATAPNLSADDGNGELLDTFVSDADLLFASGFE